MSIVKRNNDLRPFYSSLLDDFFWPYGETTEQRRRLPALNVKEDDKTLTLDLQVPGMNKDDIKLDYRNGYLTISCEKKEEKEEKDDKQKFLRKEFSAVFFQRTIELPEDKYDVSRAEALYENGILEITMPKNEEKAKLSRSIEIK